MPFGYYPFGYKFNPVKLDSYCPAHRFAQLLRQLLLINPSFALKLYF